VFDGRRRIEIGRVHTYRIASGGSSPSSEQLSLPDGESRSPLTAKASRDDVIYGRDGGFIGRASDC
jgi:hypothetical protein